MSSHSPLCHNECNNLSASIDTKKGLIKLNSFSVKTLLIRTSIFLLLMGIIISVLGPSIWGNPHIDNYSQSPQYGKQSFQNPKAIDVMSFRKTIDSTKKYFTSRLPDTVPTITIPLKPVDISAFTQQTSGDITFSRLSHSTVLISMAGHLILTDPVFSERASPFQWMGPKRFHPMPITINDLPAIDSVIISHNHYDHLDYDSIVQLKDKTTYFLVPLGIKDKLVKWGVDSSKITEMDWWETKTIGGVSFINTPAQHFSGRAMFDNNQTLWSSWVIKSDQHSLYFSGDSGYFDGFKEIGEKFGPFDVAFLECGAYNENWREVHMLPPEVITASQDLSAKLLVPIHNGTFDLALHAWYAPMEAIAELAPKNNVQYLIPAMGEVINLNAVPEQAPWWDAR